MTYDKHNIDHLASEELNPIKSSHVGEGHELTKSKDGTICSRKIVSWVKLLIFYMIFFWYLFLLFLILFTVFYLLCIKNAPYLTGSLSLLRLAPSLNFYPKTESKSSAIVFEKKNLKTLYQHMYRSTGKILPCKLDSSNNNNPKNPCNFNFKVLKECENPKDTSICIYVTLNSVYGWVPNLIDKSIPGPTLECEMENANLTKTGFLSIKYNPIKKNKAYFNHIYFPFINQRNYSRPYVSINIKIRPFYMHFFKCKLGNIKYTKESSELKFSVMTLDS